MSISFLLLLLAAICFFVAACNVTSRVNLVALGLFCWVVTLLLGR